MTSTFKDTVYERSSNHVTDMRKQSLFNAVDQDGSGSIDVPELRDGLDWLRSRAEAEEARWRLLQRA